MLKLIILMIFQSLFLVVSQVFLKIGLKKVDYLKISSINFFKIFFIYQFWLTILFIGLAGIIWIYVLKKFDFSLAYPMISISYIFALLVSVLIFNESIPFTRYFGVAIIIIGIVILSLK